MTNDTNIPAQPSRLQADLAAAVASLRCVNEIMIINEGVSSVPVHARHLLEHVLCCLEGHTAGEMQA